MYSWFSCLIDIIWILFKVPKDLDLPEAAAKTKQKEEQRRVDESEPLNEEEVKEKEELLTEVSKCNWTHRTII